MVYLSRIYTRSGDDGMTSLGDGVRVAKDNIRVEAYGAVDELNAVIGLILATSPTMAERDLLEMVSNDLFDVGADLCLPTSETEEQGKVLRVVPNQVTNLEAAIDRLNAPLEPLRSFVLPGGTVAAAWCHLARTVCRRAERSVVTLSMKSNVNPEVIHYLNRLSDLLFVMARALNQGSAGDVLWKPGASRHIEGAERQS